jgi:hypothetical protein
MPYAFCNTLEKSGFYPRETDAFCFALLEFLCGVLFSTNSHEA